MKKKARFNVGDTVTNPRWILRQWLPITERELWPSGWHYRLDSPGIPHPAIWHSENELDLVIAAPLRIQTARFLNSIRIALIRALGGNP